jgi:hypothetical protein
VHAIIAPLLFCHLLLPQPPAAAAASCKECTLETHIWNRGGGEKEVEGMEETHLGSASAIILPLLQLSLPPLPPCSALWKR